MESWSIFNVGTDALARYSKSPRGCGGPERLQLRRTGLAPTSSSSHGSMPSWVPKSENLEFFENSRFFGKSPKFHFSQNLITLISRPLLRNWPQVEKHDFPWKSRFLKVFLVFPCFFMISEIWRLGPRPLLEVSGGLWLLLRSSYGRPGPRKRTRASNIMPKHSYEH